MNAPNTQFRRRDSYDPTHPFCLGIEFAMSQEPTNVLRNRVFVDIKVDQTIPFVALTTIIEIAIEREKRRPVQVMKKGNYVIVFHPLAPNVVAMLAD
jgi:hypothetical protein